MRGKVIAEITDTVADGITPAYAGKSIAVTSKHTVHRDHPRVCGEKSAERLQRRQYTGSPPRMRGKACNGAFNFIIIGDHPRVCGEKARRSCRRHTRRGSPPRMRGKVKCGESLILPARITPAYAGKSVLYICVICIVWDHPRVCGEKHSWLSVGTVS